ncbi:MAG: flagellar export protein FliJ [Calditrichia bacterium]
MKKYRFRLQKVLDVKEVLVKQSQRDLAAAQEEKRQAEEELKRSEQAVKQFARKLEEESFATVAELQQKYDYFYQMLENLDAQKDVVLQMDQKVEKVRQKLIQNQRNRKVLAALKEKSYQDYLEKVKLEEQIALDEMAILGGNTLNG